MDENRAQAYLHLIQQLLDCPNGDEPQILQANSELLDGEFLQTCEQVATMLAEQGQENLAGFLRNLASQLGEFLGVTSAEGNEGENNSLEDYQRFLQLLLQTEYENAGRDPRHIYAVLQANLDKLNLNFIPVLQQGMASLLGSIDEPEQAETFAALIENIAIKIDDFPRGRRADNQEIAIAAYEIVLSVHTRGTNPEKWAQTQNNLAVAYKNRIRGERADNLEGAIACYQSALEVRTRNAFPEKWAMTQNNLGEAYRNRIRGERADNLEGAIVCYQSALEVYTREAFPQQWATTQNNLAVAYKDRIRGERADNLEQAIACFHRALGVRTRDDFPQYWAETQNNLAVAYSNRIRGERADNLEAAIACFQIALEVRTREAFPEKWAATQNNLAVAYKDRIRGERADNLEGAIACYQSALEVRTRDAFPQDWAMTQNNLAVAYKDRIRGERADNLERAIACYQSALEVLTREAFPQEWADTQNNLAIAYYSRIRGERADNLERAIACFQIALEVRTREAFPEKWAATQNNLAVAYKDRIRGERADNLEGAIACYQSALEVRTRDAFPQDWAMTQNNLAVAYKDRIRGERADNLERAIACYQSALEVLTRDAFPEQWATTQNNLAVAYSDRIRGERADNLEGAIACYQSALEVYTSDAFPEKWAATQNNLANAYYSRIRGEQADNLKEAIKSYRQALEIRTPTALPLDCLQTGRNLGNLAFELPDWENAIYGYDNAISAVEQSREWATSQRSKRQILQDALPIYERMVRACIAAQRYDTALLAIERSKSRTLIELLDNARLYPANITPSQKQRLDELRRQIASLQQQLDSRETPAAGDPDTSIDGNRGATPATTPAANPEAELKIQQQQLTQLLAEINDPNFNLTQIVKPQLPDFTQLLNAETALIEWYIPPNSESGFYAFIVTLAGDPQIQPLSFTPSHRQQLDTDISTYLSDYRQPTWGKALSHRLVALAESLHLKQILAQLPPTIQKLILIPHRDLHLLPLHALTATRQLEDGTNQTGDLLDLYPQGIQYAPSSQFLERLHQRQRPAQTAAPPFFGIQNPTEDLNYTEIEVETIARQFNPDIHILKRQEATKTAFNSADNLAKLSLACYAHFSCHGSFNPQFPLNSALILAKDCPVEKVDSVLPVGGDPPQPPLKRGEKERIKRGEEERINGKEEEMVKSRDEERTSFEDRYRYVTLRDGRRFDTISQGLTLKEIFANLNLPQCRLVTLSACETGLVDRLLTDEYIGLASGFLYAGATNVVSSLWSVSDFSTTFLMIRFYQELPKNTSVALALQAAQNWLKTVVREDFLIWLTNDLKMDANQVAELKILLRRSFPKIQPFAEPVYWAAFCAIGL